MSLNVSVSFFIEKLDRNMTNIHNREVAGRNELIKSIGILLVEINIVKSSHGKRGFTIPHLPETSQSGARIAETLYPPTPS
mmetsp:Transcript_9420/g.5592  ORF Transcript_9420/g.5592 Transcript_9420/m.5592 type:complete len:81 (+) Transcript_9420:22-264(+)